MKSMSPRATPKYGSIQRDPSEVCDDSLQSRHSFSPWQWKRIALLAVSITLLGFTFASQQKTTVVDSVSRVIQVDRPEPVNGWVFQRAADPSQLLQLVLMLTPRDVDGLFERAYAVSNPTSADFGKHLDLEAVQSLVKPTPESLAVVEDWLRSHGIGSQRVERGASGDTMTVTVPVSVAENLLGADYNVYENADYNVYENGRGNADVGGPRRGSRRITRTLKYSLPPHISDIVDWVGPTAEFPLLKSIVAVKTLSVEKTSAGENATSQAKSTESSPSDAATTASGAGGLEGGNFEVDDLFGVPGDEKLIVEEAITDYQARRQSDDPGTNPPLVSTDQSETSEPPPVEDFRRRRRLKAELESSGAGAGEVTPDTIRAMYGIPRPGEGIVPSGVGNASNIQAVVAFLGEHLPSAIDLQTFQQKYSAGSTAPAMPERMTQSTRGTHFGGLESTLDLEYIMSVAPGIKTEFYYFDGKINNADGDAENEPFLAWLQHVNSGRSAAHVYSVSYADWEESVPRRYADRVNVELAKLAARGVSIIVASGDGGVEGAAPLPHSAWKHRCRANDAFKATFPSGSPWVTSVGASTGNYAGADLSAGGFSNYFPQPEWQKEEVSRYLICLPTVNTRRGGGGNREEGGFHRRPRRRKLAADDWGEQQSSEKEHEREIADEQAELREELAAQKKKDAEEKRSRAGRPLPPVDVHPDSSVELDPRTDKDGDGRDDRLEFFLRTHSGAPFADPLGSAEAAAKNASSGAGGETNSAKYVQKMCTSGHDTDRFPHLPPPEQFNPKGRAFPDVSAEGKNIKVFYGHDWKYTSGTSASAPIFAGVISLVNDMRISRGRRPLGFLNQMLYSAEVRKTFHDITEGNNPGCGRDGYYASKGWDPVTGLGTPRFSELADALLNMP